MASNSFGTAFRITTWGESHGKAIGVVIDGCPAGLDISEDEINKALSLRAPGKSRLTSPRKEPDHAEILSGVFEGRTTGAPISIIIHNIDADSSKYEPIKKLMRPGHANFTYLQKYGAFDYRGGGRASARETACRVAAGAIAKKLLAQEGITVSAKLTEVGGLAKNWEQLVEQAKKTGDSLGGIIEFCIEGCPAGFGEPVYGKFQAQLASAMMSLPAAKGFEIGEGFQAARMKGSEHNDSFMRDEGGIKTVTNHAGGILGGLTNGMPVVGRVAMKPPSSIRLEQKTVDDQGNAAVMKLPPGSRHDPCVAIRAVPVVEAMAALVTIDALLLNRLSKIAYNVECQMHMN